MLINKKLTTAIATGAIIVNAMLPALAHAETGVGLLGNGAASSNAVNVTQNNNSTATQNNAATITNHVDAKSNTGGNDANFNTGGDTRIQTGAASNGISVKNTANSNFIFGGNHCCDNGATILEEGNGAYSTNTASLLNNNNKTATQNNAANFTNDIDAKATTGKNSASDNTGGDTSIMTGPASNWTEVVNTANKNVMVGTGATAGTGATHLTIDGNGALSANAITDTNNNTAVAIQNNAATFFNDGDAQAKTGKNDANYNTGGGNAIQTGPALNWTGVANIANKNVLDAFDCGCATGDIFKVADNGAFSGNTITATKNDTKVTEQDNAADFSNYADSHALTGDNEISDATGSFWVDGNGILTGHAVSETQVVNTSNSNEISTNEISFGGLTWGFTWNPGSILGL